jgi:molybdopterin-guanine dinucleotide biosynthesis protein A
MNNKIDSLKVLILAGGHSSRMGSPKHLLPLPDGPLYRRLIEILHQAMPDTKTIYFSIAHRSTLDDTLRNGHILLSQPGDEDLISIQLELVSDVTEQEIGPAAGLMAAFSIDPTATWLIVACDYPLLQAEAMHQLLDCYEAPVTCFKNAEGFSEPLLAIWDPGALQTLSKNVKSGHSGPSYTLKHLGGKLISPNRHEWLLNVNTKPEWEAAKARMEQI